MTTIFNPSGEVLHVPDPSPAEFSAAMAETCYRIARRRIDEGETTGRAIPDPLSKWRVEWAPIYEGSPVIEVQVQCAAETSQDERTAAYNRLNEFTLAHVVPLGRTRGIAFNMSIEVKA